MRHLLFTIACLLSSSFLCAGASHTVTIEIKKPRTELVKIMDQQSEGLSILVQK
jgi:hypothetical protein